MERGFTPRVVVGPGVGVVRLVGRSHPSLLHRTYRYGVNMTLKVGSHCHTGHQGR